MDLHTYCTENGGTGLRGCPVLTQVGKRAACSSDTLYMIAKGHKRPSALLAGFIEQATGGAVTRQELRPDVFRDLPQKSEVA